MRDEHDPLRGTIFASVVDTYENADLNRGSFNDTTGRVPVALSEACRGRTAVLLIFGQSNGANSGSTRYTPRQHVFNFNWFDSTCYFALDPLLGTTDQNGNFATRLGDLLIEHGIFDSVVLVSISIGGSRIEEWTTGGSRHRRLQLAVKRAKDAGLTFSHLLWHQGESNARHDPDGDLYAACFMNIHRALRAYGTTAPIYVAQATICDSPPNDAIRAAQRNVVNPSLGILAGPDTDEIGPADRYDGCHMSDSGLDKHASLWFETLARG